jgi:hemerythrin
MKQNLFDLIPYINEHIATENEGELSVITFPRFRGKFMMKFFVPRNKSPKIRIRLDEHGTAVWNLIDGRQTVKQISDALSDHFNHEENYEYRVAKYFAQLHKQGFVKYY